MCGIAGIIDPGRRPEALDGILTKMLQVQGHRGPDATGNYSDGPLYLGHNRLSIIDLSDAANQPMHFEGLSIIFNGEIYNYLEIREELGRLGHRFVTRSDTEVILHAFKEWGHRCVDRFVGMWALAIWNAENKTLFASRDRFGIKPFYYIDSAGSFYFSSEVKTLKVTPVFKNDLNLNQVARGLQLGWLSYHDETYFNCIRSLPAAHNLIWHDGEVKVERYWDLDNVQPVKGTFSEKSERFEALFRDSIRLHLRSDVPVASCLSGGLDSSAIVSMVQDMYPGQPYKSFSIYYDGEGEVDERPFIREVIEKYPAVQPIYFKPSDEEVRDEFGRALYHADVPAAGSSFISQYFLMKLIGNNGIKVVLDGQGADEYLAGYMHSFYRLAGGLLRKGALMKGLAADKEVSAKLGLGLGGSFAHLGKSVMAALLSEQELYTAEYKRYHPFLTEISPAASAFQLKDFQGSRLNAFLYHLIFTTSLPSLLQYEDRNSMAFSIESRVPFLDHRMVEFCFGLNDEDKLNGTTTKYIMREALQKVLPSAVYQRKDKKGFVTPGENKWLRGPLSFLLDKSPQDLPFIRKDRAAELIRQYKAGDNSRSTIVWRLAVLNEWINRN